MSDYNYIAKRADFTMEEVRTAYLAGKSASPEHPYAGMAEMLTAHGRGEVRRNRAREWALALPVAERVDPLGDYMGADTLRAHRHQSVQNNRLRRENRALADELNGRDGFLQAIEEAVSRLKVTPLDLPNTVNGGDPTGTPCTVELLLSDLQIGKIGGSYNTEIAIRRLQEYTDAAIDQIYQKIGAGYDIERIVLCLLGDIIESDKKHSNSARATDTGTAQQIADAVEYIYKLVIAPLAQMGAPMEVICITGNHDHDDHGIMMFQPGKQHLSWPLYQSLRLITEAAGIEHVQYIIPEGVFAVTEFYGQRCLYEHGVGVSVSESSMRSHKAKRAEQLNMPITYFRMGWM